VRLTGVNLAGAVAFYGGGDHAGAHTAAAGRQL